MNYVNVQSYLDQDLEKQSTVEVKVTLQTRHPAERGASLSREWQLPHWLLAQSDAANTNMACGVPVPVASGDQQLSSVGKPEFVHVYTKVFLWLTMYFNNIVSKVIVNWLVHFLNPYSGATSVAAVL